MNLSRPLLFLLLATLGLRAQWDASGPRAQWGGELRFCLHSEPRSLHPALADDDASETVRYLTGGVLLRVNRATQKIEPELAASYRIDNNGRTITFLLRENVTFSDGTPFTAEDVAHTMRALMDPALHSATGDPFRSSAGPVTAVARGK